MTTTSQAADRLTGIIRQTPLQYNDRLSQSTGARVYLKREDLQVGKSYKIRGALNLMASLSGPEHATGAVTASTGNHARAVAWAAHQLKLQTIVFVPTQTRDATVADITRAGLGRVEVRRVGQNLTEALAAATKHAARTGATLVHPYDDPRIVAGQGTIASEIISQLAELGDAPQVVVAPIGGGGLVTGLSEQLEQAAPAARLIGVRPTSATGILRSLAAGNQVTARLHQTVAVTPRQVARTMLELLAADGIIAEPAGALATAALPALQRELYGQTVVVIISGGNQDPADYAEIIRVAVS